MSNKGYYEEMVRHLLEKDDRYTEEMIRNALDNLLDEGKVELVSDEEGYLGLQVEDEDDDQ